MDKAKFRELYKNKRLSLSSEKCLLLDQMLLENLRELDFDRIKYLHVYLSIRKFKEPDTLAFIDYLKTSYPYIQLVISKTDFQTNTMVNYLWDEHITLQENKWGILEPKEGVICNDLDIDMVLIPLLVADKLGNRVGYGKGFYDRFLSKCKPSIEKVGISYFDPVDKINHIDSWDIRLDRLITPNGLYDFAK